MHPHGKKWNVMKKAVYLYVTLCLLAILVGCTTEGERAAMRAGLDSINVRNRTDRPFTVRDVEPYVRFFDDHGTANDRLLAHYLLGRAYYEHGEAPMALQCYHDAVSGPYYAGAFHFRDGADEDLEYEYDENGSMTKDLNKNISSIQYNSLNLPTSITYSDGRSAAYIYGAGGKKLRVSYKTSPVSTPVPTDYCGNVIYENNVLKQILVDGGYITFSGTTPQYHFYLKDHLGNNRVVCNASGTVEQVNHYYPFGGLMGESTGGDVQRFKYNGKELDRMHGLDWYDYGARHYDAARGAFTTIDPLTHKYYDVSPYVYCLNNPINAFDPDGRNPFIGFVVGAGVDYAAQVIGNIASGNTSFTEAFTHDIDMGSIAAKKNARIDKVNNKIDNVMESGKDLASKSIGNMTNKLVKEWIEKEK